ncbi:hypothetical protein [Streptosporangium sp. NPDC004631]
MIMRPLDNGAMSRGALMWVGGVVSAGTATGLAVYFAVVGLEQAEKIATVLALFVALAGLALAIPGIIEIRRAKRSPLPRESDRPSPPRSAPTTPPDGQGVTEKRSVNQYGTNNIYSEGSSQIHIGNKNT